MKHATRAYHFLPMNRRIVVKLIAVGAVAILVVVIAAGVILSRANRQSAIATATAWARLAPLPPSAQNVQLDAKGSPFTREIVIRFDASPAVIQQWIAASPGPSSAVRSTRGAITTFTISPGGGAQFAEVQVDTIANRVVIRTYWS